MAKKKNIKKAINPDTGKKGGGILAAFKRLFGAYSNYDKNQDDVSLVPTTGGFSDRGLIDLTGHPSLGSAGLVDSNTYPYADGEDCNADAAYRFGALPGDRLACYDIFQTMATDPTIAIAINNHVTAALQADIKTGKSISIESVNDNKESKYVDDLRITFEHMINQMAYNIAQNASIYGCTFVRSYGAKGIGIKKIRYDYYTHARHTWMWEQAGELAGFTSLYQDQAVVGKLRLMPPWDMIPFRIPLWDNNGLVEPVRTDGQTFDLSREDYEQECVVESQNYGKSLLHDAFDAWWDLQEAIVSLNMSRQAASRLERLCGINVGGLDPSVAQKYINIISNQMDKTAIKNRKESIRRGYIPTVINRLIPIFGDSSKGQVDINETASSADISAIEDVMFHLRRMAGSLGSDPGLLGFGEELSGGLGEGGWNRTSIIAALYSNLIRQAMTNGLNRLFEIHLAYKFGKVWIADDRPWRIQYNSVSSALEAEHRENQEAGVNLATALAGLMGELAEQGNPALSNMVLTDFMNLEEEKVRDILSHQSQPEEEGGDEDGGGGGGEPKKPGGNGKGGGRPDNINESVSATAAQPDAVEQEFYHGG